MERVHMTDYFFGADQKIPNWLIKIAFLWKSKLQLEDFPGTPVFKTPHFHCKVYRFNP